MPARLRVKRNEHRAREASAALQGQEMLLSTCTRHSLLMAACKVTARSQCMEGSKDGHRLRAEERVHRELCSALGVCRRLPGTRDRAALRLSRLLASAHLTATSSYLRGGKAA